MKKTLFVVCLTFLGIATVQAAPSMEGVSNLRCLRVCSCQGSEDEVEVKCRGLTEGRWPGVYPLNTASLDLSHNAMHRVNAMSLQGKGLDHLTSLTLANCGLSTIDPEAFRGLRQLTSLDLSFNDITGLKADHFKDLESLQVLRLTGNDWYECKRLRVALPEVKIICGIREKTSPSTTEASLNVYSSTEPSVTPKTSTQTPVTSTPKSTVTANPTPSMPTPSYTDTPVTPTDTAIAASGGVGSGSAVAIGVVCFLGGALVVALVLFVRPWCQGYRKTRGQEDGEP